MEYLGRYSHKIAISNHRLLNMEDGKVSFRWKNYRTLKNGQMQLSAMEFLRRFCLHILPKGFPRIRHYGFLASRSKQQKLKAIRKSLGHQAPPKQAKLSWQQIAQERLGFTPDQCPACGGTMVVIEILPPHRGPPEKPAATSKQNAEL